jgi:hypothetical protein
MCLRGKFNSSHHCLAGIQLTHDRNIVTPIESLMYANLLVNFVLMLEVTMFSVALANVVQTEDAKEATRTTTVSRST